MTASTSDRSARPSFLSHQALAYTPLGLTKSRRVVKARVLAPVGSSPTEPSNSARVDCMPSLPGTPDPGGGDGAAARTATTTAGLAVASGRRRAVGAGVSGTAAARG